MTGKDDKIGYHVTVPLKWVKKKTKELLPGEKKYLEQRLKWYIGDLGKANLKHELHKV